MQQFSARSVLEDKVFVTAFLSAFLLVDNFVFLCALFGQLPRLSLRLPQNMNFHMSFTVIWFPDDYLGAYFKISCP
jgi:hypothetical protein